MPRRVLLLTACLASGCLNDSSSNGLVPSNPFAGSPAAPSAPPPQASASPATQETSLRVLKVAQKVLAANPQVQPRPLFSTVGASAVGPPAEEIFHIGEQQVVVTETMVRKCETDGQLAAILCVELAKMAQERQVRLGPTAGNDLDAEPPPDPPVGKDAAGAFGPADGTRLAELARFERAHRRSLRPPPDPRALAAVYLSRAGYTPDDLEAANPLLRAAEANVKLEKQMRAK
jgi:hypothetical protein